MQLGSPKGGYEEPPLRLDKVWACSAVSSPPTTVVLDIGVILRPCKWWLSEKPDLLRFWKHRFAYFEKILKMFQSMLSESLQNPVKNHHLSRNASYQGSAHSPANKNSNIPQASPTVRFKAAIRKTPATNTGQLLKHVAVMICGWPMLLHAWVANAF